MKDNTTHFGYQKVPLAQKQNLVNGVFNSVAHRYDVMNDLMSLGLHRLWKKQAIAQLGLNQQSAWLDVACGSGDLVMDGYSLVKPNGKVVGFDINTAMLEVAEKRALDKGLVVDWVVGNAEKMPFKAEQFSAISFAFGLRNVAQPPQAIRECFRVAKPKARLVILEFSKVDNPFFKKIYDTYSFQVLPLLGQLVAQDKKSYEYLAQSIRQFYNADELSGVLENAGWSVVQSQIICQGVVAIHTALKCD